MPPLSCCHDRGPDLSETTFRSTAPCNSSSSPSSTSSSSSAKARYRHGEMRFRARRTPAVLGAAACWTTALLPNIQEILFQANLNFHQNLVAAKQHRSTRKSSEHHQQGREKQESLLDAALSSVKKSAEDLLHWRGEGQNFRVHKKMIVKVKKRKRSKKRSGARTAAAGRKSSSSSTSAGRVYSSTSSSSRSGRLQDGHRQDERQQLRKMNKKQRRKAAKGAAAAAAATAAAQMRGLQKKTLRSEKLLVREDEKDGSGSEEEIPDEEVDKMMNENSETLHPDEPVGLDATTSTTSTSTTSTSTTSTTTTKAGTSTGSFSGASIRMPGPAPAPAPTSSSLVQHDWDDGDNSTEAPQRTTAGAVQIQDADDTNSTTMSPPKDAAGQHQGSSSSAYLTTAQNNVFHNLTNRSSEQIGESISTTSSSTTSTTAATTTTLAGGDFYTPEAMVLARNNKAGDDEDDEINRTQSYLQKQDVVIRRRIPVSQYGQNNLQGAPVAGGQQVLQAGAGPSYPQPALVVQGGNGYAAQPPPALYEDPQFLATASDGQQLVQSNLLQGTVNGMVKNDVVPQQNNQVPQEQQQLQSRQRVFATVSTTGTPNGPQIQVPQMYNNPTTTKQFAINQDGLEDEEQLDDWPATTNSYEEDGEYEDSYDSGEDDYDSGEDAAYLEEQGDDSDEDDSTNSTTTGFVDTNTFREECDAATLVAAWKACGIKDSSLKDYKAGENTSDLVWEVKQTHLCNTICMLASEICADLTGLAARRYDEVTCSRYWNRVSEESIVVTETNDASSKAMFFGWRLQLLFTFVFLLFSVSGFGDHDHGGFLGTTAASSVGRSRQVQGVW
ncbi:unnamed protein product [Amoebophrya sp. A120]|nr:unnamed protein product [Amoebophrya sp. A120]|eukprot:GSA120T00024819001.1